MAFFDKTYWEAEFGFTVSCSCFSATKLVICPSLATYPILVLELPSGKVLFSTVTAAKVDTCVFLDAAHVGMYSYTTTSGRILDTTTGVITTTGAVGYCYNTGPAYPYQFAADLTNSEGLCSSYVPGKLLKLTAAGVGTLITAGISTVYYPIFNLSSYTYVAQGSNNNIYKLDNAGTILSTLTYNSNYAYSLLGISSDKTKLYTSSLGPSATGNFTILNASDFSIYDTLTLCSAPQKAISNEVNGLVLTASTNFNASPTVTALWDIQQYPYCELDEVINMQLITNYRLDSTNSLAYFILSTAMAAIQMKGLVGTTVPARARDSDIDKAQRVIRICNPQNYRGRVESDTDLPSGKQDVAVRFKDIDYIEISSINTPFSNEKLDFRRFP